VYAAARDLPAGTSLEEEEEEDLSWSSGQAVAKAAALRPEIYDQAVLMTEGQHPAGDRPLMNKNPGRRQRRWTERQQKRKDG
jgi:hypothetical protein